MRTTENSEKQIYSKRLCILLFSICFIVYTFAYFARINYSIALTELSAILSPKTAGLIGSIYFLCYAVGQIVNGFYADRSSPFLYLTIGTLVITVSNLIMGFISKPFAFIIVWGINGFGQSMLWGPILIIISRLMLKKYKHIMLLIISVAAPLGTLLCYLAGGFLLQLGYRVLFFAAAGLLLLVLPFAIVIFVTAIRNTTTSPENASNEVSPILYTNDDNISAMPLRTLSVLPTILLIVAVMSQGILKDGTSTWLPTILSEKYTLNAGMSSFLVMVLPLINISGAFIAEILYKKFRRNKEFLLCFLFMAFALICLFLLKIEMHQFTFVIFFSLITTAMFGFNQVTLAYIPQRFEKRRKIAFVSGTLNAFTYLGSAFATFFIGWIKETSHWQGVLTTLIITALIGSIAVIIAHLSDSKNIQQHKNTIE